VRIRVKDGEKCAKTPSFYGQRSLVISSKKEDKDIDLDGYPTNLKARYQAGFSIHNMKDLQYMK
jgi:hypothetical protein